MKSALEGALTVVKLALLPQEAILGDGSSGIYFTDDLAMLPLLWVRDEAKQEALWQETSESLGMDASL